ncbi:MAG: 23S rRNA (cytosine(1962)-C(5))-methyltransferase RlmI [Candidatus Thermofonsia Clade 1 bacterium]|jgi:23S rRNA (cytosine1962-C5)-methyltransferase|uniref:23S rRNA (Cytosine(1962)-C(5))-methyltransferase RlmI n=1 Tax=Candidatus Thermofonsia Clade 1 bacterium TaxID=2364210 RepID=A0A2M8PDS1_9CHLR|nr:MAG: 23S rRNA (cytosine(1962)-C(5))-methyltransferase RlmI [Candidatus Thermofonsia Clade 1 bacterium]RMF53267.1 MAG: class I SAM-dependent rRNA methyltransferase [Chloroflexota bacterium]
MSEATVRIRSDRAKTLSRRHPWLFSGAVQSVEGAPSDGEIVTLRSADPQATFLGRGYWNSRSQIAVHILTWQDEPITPAFWQARLERAIGLRQPLHNLTTAYRLINAESDSLPGLIVDRYGDWLVLQALTYGIDRRKAELAAWLSERLPEVRGIYERSDVDVRAKEGLPPSVGVLLGESPPPLIEIEEAGCRYAVDVYRGHKTGFYLDQRENRMALADYLRTFLPQAQVLNCFAYTGSFAIAALRHGAAAHVLNLDASAEALALARHNYALNGLSVEEDAFLCGDVFQVLRQLRAQGRQFDCIVLDPPKFAHAQRQIERATRGYKDINLLAFQLLRSGGCLATFSCSGLIDADLFQKIVFGALEDSGREAQILRRLSAGVDHPVSLTFPEGFYLKGLLCRVW